MIAVLVVWIGNAAAAWSLCDSFVRLSTFLKTSGPRASRAWLLYILSQPMLLFYLRHHLGCHESYMYICLYPDLVASSEYSEPLALKA
jgi:hypothetical protein